MDVTERFLHYISIKTDSDESSARTPSSACQLNLAATLEEEMRAMGIADAQVSDFGYVYGSIPATVGCEKLPALGLIAHMDTSPDFSGENIHARLIPDYDGADVPLGSSGRVLSCRAFPHLQKLKGRTLIVTDGTTLLGSDDKAGIAEILSACEEILKSPLPHCKICLAFTPDEEVGRGADHFDIHGFGADYAYTVDGGAEGEVNFENFNAAAARFTIHGFNIHPGSAKDTMINAALLASEINSMLPAGETPRYTEDYEGFFHLTGIQGTVEQAESTYIIRDHKEGNFEARKDTLRHIAKLLNQKYGEGTVSLEIHEQYRNMREIIGQYPFLIEKADQAMRLAGMEPQHLPIRGGTDGARLSFMGLPCPNLSTGGYAYHGPYEHNSVEGLTHCTRMLIELIRQFSKQEN